MNDNDQTSMHQASILVNRWSEFSVFRVLCLALGCWLVSGLSARAQTLPPFPNGGSVFRAAREESTPILDRTDRGGRPSSPADPVPNGASSRPEPSVFYTFAVNTVPETIESFVPDARSRAIFTRRAAFTKKMLQTYRGNLDAYRARLKGLHGAGKVVASLDGGLDALDAGMRAIYDNDYAGGFSSGTTSLVRSIMIRQLAAGGAALAVAAGAPAYVGVGAAAVAIVALSEYAIKPGLDYGAVYAALSDIQSLVAEAESLVRDHKLEQAYATALKAQEALVQARTSSAAVSASSQPAALNARILEVMGAYARAKQAVSRAESTIAALVSDARRGELRDSGAAIGRALTDRAHLQAAGREDLIQRLENLPAELAKLAPPAPSKANPGANANHPTTPAADPKDLIARKAQPQFLRGSGPWRSGDGKRVATISCGIDVSQQSFTGTYQGQFVGGTSKFVINFNGKYSGDTTHGTLQGTGSSGGRVVYHIQGKLTHGVVSGTVSHGDDVDPFTLPVK